MQIENNVHAKNILKFIKKHDDIFVLSADLGSSCEIKQVSQQFPERYISMGIAEQNMLSWASGMAREGLRPFIHTFAVFLYRRALDQLIMSIAYPNLPVVLLGFVPGITTPGGITHQSIDDVGILRTIPNLNIFDCGDATDVESVLGIAYELNAPIYIRMLRGDVPRLFNKNSATKFNKARIVRRGTDLTILSSSICTEEVMRINSLLQAHNIAIEHLHITTLKPFSDPTIISSIKKARHGVITIENHSIIGGLGTAVAELMVENQITKPLIKLGINDQFTHGASKPYLMKKYGIDVLALINVIQNLLGIKIEVNQNEIDKVRIEDYAKV